MYHMVPGDDRGQCDRGPIRISKGAFFIFFLQTTNSNSHFIMADMNFIAKQFTDYYYRLFDFDPIATGGETRETCFARLYRDNSMLTYENDQLVGIASIINKITSLPFQAVKHIVSTCDAQPTPSGIIVLVTGQLIVDDGNPLHFSQMFHLLPDGGSYYVYNDVFRLNYG